MNNDTHKLECDIDIMDPSDFMMLAFERNIGVIMPYEEHYENNDVIVYLSNLVDPATNYDQFRKTLII